MIRVGVNTPPVQNASWPSFTPQKHLDQMKSPWYVSLNAVQPKWHQMMIPPSRFQPHISWNWCIYSWDLHMFNKTSINKIGSKSSNPTININQLTNWWKKPWGFQNTTYKNQIPPSFHCSQASTTPWPVPSVRSASPRPRHQHRSRPRARRSTGLGCPRAAKQSHSDRSLRKKNKKTEGQLLNVDKAHDLCPKSCIKNTKTLLYVTVATFATQKKDVVMWILIWLHECQDLWCQQCQLILCLEYTPSTSRPDCFLVALQLVAWAGWGTARPWKLIDHMLTPAYEPVSLKPRMNCWMTSAGIRYPAVMAQCGETADIEMKEYNDIMNDT